MRCLYTADLHGNLHLYERLFEAVDRFQAEALLLGGDLSPLVPPLDVMIREQGAFWSGFLWPRARALASNGTRLILIPGNDDLRFHDPLLERGHEEGVWELVDGRAVKLGPFSVIGCSTVSVTPFVLKDREAWDVEAGVSSEPDAIALGAEANVTSIEPDPLERGRTLLERLEDGFTEMDPAQPTILMAHCPPRDTKLDVLHDGRRIGAAAVRRVIERHRPVLGLHGHIHESPQMPGGDWIDRIGDTVIVNPGSSHHGRGKARLHLISFDTADLAGTIAYERL